VILELGVLRRSNRGQCHSSRFDRVEEIEGPHAASSLSADGLPVR
jgi:hypothetical protein